MAKQARANDLIAEGDGSQFLQCAGEVLKRKHANMQPNNPPPTHTHTNTTVNHPRLSKRWVITQEHPAEEDEGSRAGEHVKREVALH